MVYILFAFLLHFGMCIATPLFSLGLNLAYAFWRIIQVHGAFRPQLSSISHLYRGYLPLFTQNHIIKLFIFTHYSLGNIA